MKHRLERKAVMLITLFCFGLSCWLFFPGGMNYDSLNQYYQALGILPTNDWHPLIMTRLWQVCNSIFQGPHLMLVMFMAFYWIGVGLLAMAISVRLISRVTILLVLGFFPPSFLVMSTVWKDAGMMAFLVFSASIIYLSTIVEEERAKRLLVFGTLAGLIGVAFRHNAIVAIAPIFGMIFFINHISKITKVIMFSSLMLLAYGLPKVVNTLGVDVRNPYLENQLFAWNISGISVQKGEMMIPNYALYDSTKVNLDLVSEYYDYRTNNGVIFNAQIFNPFIWTDKAIGKRFRTDALRIIRLNLPEYARIRWEYTEGMLFGSRWWPNLAYQFVVGQFPGDEKLGIEMYHMLNPMLLHQFERRIIAPMVHYKLFTAAPYLVLLLLVCYLNLIAIIKRHLEIPPLVMLSFAFALSGLLYWIPYVIVGPSDDFRYSSWTVFCSIASAMIYLSWCFRRSLTKGFTEEELDA